MRTIAVANLKGGTGKTATCHALGVVLASQYRRRVLLVDCDPQASLTGACGIRNARAKSLAEALDRAFHTRLQLELFMHHITLKAGPRVDLVPSDAALARSERRLVSRTSGELLLRGALRTMAFSYDLALLDCPPHLGLLMTNALAAADAVLIPTRPNILDLRALRVFLDSLQEVRGRLNPQLETLGILVTFFDNRLNHHKRVVHAMQGLGLPMLDVMIGRSVRVAEASHESHSVVDYAPRHKEAEAYRQLGAVVDEWLAKRSPRLRWLREAA